METASKRHVNERGREAMPDRTGRAAVAAVLPGPAAALALGTMLWAVCVGYSLLGESFTNFGAAGPLLQYVGLGLAWNLVWLGVVRRLITNDTLFMSLYAVYGYYLLIMMHRGPFSGIVTELAHTLPPLLLVHWFIDKAVIAGLSRPGIADGQGLKAR